MHRCLHAVRHLIQDHAKKYHIPVQFAAAKIVENDQVILEQLHLDQNEQDMLEHMIVQMEHESGKDRQAAMADMRYAFIEKVCAQTVVKPQESKAHTRSRKLDQILTGKWTAIPVFIGIMALVFYLTFGLIGTGLSDLLDLGIGWLTDQVDGALTIWGVNEVVHSLVIDGVFAGVGTVLSFLPIIVVRYSA